MGVKYNHTKFEQETQRWWPGMGVTSGGPKFQNLSKMVKKKSHFFSQLLVPIGSLEGGIGKKANIDGEQTPLATVNRVSHPSSGPNGLFLGPSYGKIGVVCVYLCVYPLCIPF